MKIAIYRDFDGFCATPLSNYYGERNSLKVAHYYAEDGFTNHADVVMCMCRDGGYSMTLDDFYFF